MFEQFLENIYIASPSGHGRFPQSFCFYIDDDRKALIDTPLDPRFTDLVKGKPVDLIINSHFHRDHSGCNHYFPDAKISAHPLDIPAMQSRDEFIRYYGLMEYGSKELCEGVLNFLQYTPSQIHDELNDGDIINLGKVKLEVIHTPGHTPGHCAFHWREKNIVFSGDIDLTSFGPWYGNLLSDVDDTITSIKRIIALKPEIILSGHQGIINQNPVGELKKYLQILFDKENRILKALEKGKTLDALCEEKIIYGRWPNPPFLYAFFEKMSLIVHLRRLLKLGVVVQDGEKYYSNNKNIQEILR